MAKLTDKEVILLLESLVNSRDLRLRINVKEDVVSATLTYKDRKILSSTRQ